MGRLPRIYELSVLLARTTNDADLLAAGNSPAASALSPEMLSFLQGLEESEMQCALLSYGRALTQCCLPDRWQHARRKRTSQEVSSRRPHA